MTDRDPEIGAALAALDVPEHGETFWADLTARLREEAAPPAPRAVPLASRRRRHALRLATVAAAAAVVAVAVGVGVGPENGPLAPRPASAAEVADRVTATLARARSLRGTLVQRGREGAGARTAFVTTSAGDLRLDTTYASGETGVVAYDAARGVEEGYTLPAPGQQGAFGGRRTGLAPVQTPDQGPMDWVLRMDLSAALRAQESTAPATETTYDGRAAWVLEADAQPQDSAGDQAIDHIAATIDKETALPLRIVESRNGATIRELTVEGLVVDAPVPPGTFDLTMPRGVTVSATDHGFRRVPLDRVSAATGYRPLVPSALPAGFGEPEVAVADEAGHTGAEGLNPASREVVSIAYRRGFDRVLVTTRLRGTGDWTDPMASGEGIVDRPERVTLGGALDGARAELLVSAQGTAPHVWALTDDLVVTVSGDLTRDELLAVAGSLAPYGG
jgi:outer membrane lipoprotein-sorting protein